MHIQAKPPARVYFGGSLRRSAGSLARFVGTDAHADRHQAALPADHPAVTDGRTRFLTRVFSPDDAPRVLVSGHNNAKIGAKITKGPWRGCAVYTLTLEERATCPTSCGLWRECYGNSMPLARRHAHGPELIEALGRELRALARAHPRGFAVRLHVLGDFYSPEYAAHWMAWLATIKPLRIWGYTAHHADSEIGTLIARANAAWPDRWSVRFSVPPTASHRPQQATTIWRQPEAAVVPEGVICPAQTHGTAACATCGLCWAPAAADKRIVFIGHGMTRSGSGVMRQRRKAMESPQPETPTPAPTGSSAPVVQAPSGGAFTHDERELLRGIASALERLLKVVVQRHAASAMAPQKRDTSVGAAPAGARPREDGSANSSHAAMEGTAADAPLPSFAPQPAGEPSAPAAMPTIPPEPPRHRLANRGFDDARHMALKRLWRVVPPLPTVDVVRALNEVSPHLGALDKQRVANEASRLKLGARDWSASPQAQAPPPISAPAPPAPPALLAPIPPLQQQQQQQPVIIPAVAPQDADFVCVGKLLSYVQVLDIAERMGVAFTGKNLGSINRVRARNGFPPIEAAR